MKKIAATLAVSVIASAGALAPAVLTPVSNGQDLDRGVGCFVLKWWPACWR
ncbi:hypothetical protein [Nigerium massiliense]|uniref:hypothetical protein n=1 Tax=Nigerium massiliense TaxID=1522317 RepID=UPI0012FD8763|nr:hypothetical protein [Nigerium massiliense]